MIAPPSEVRAGVDALVRGDGAGGEGGEGEAGQGGCERKAHGGGREGRVKDERCVVAEVPLGLLGPLRSTGRRDRAEFRTGVKGLNGGARSRDP